MKFAIAALLGVVSGYRMDINAEDGQKIGRSLESIGRTFETAEKLYPEYAAEAQAFADDVAQWGEKVGPKYLPKLEAWGKSAAVRAAREHKWGKLMPSREVRAIGFHARLIERDFEEDMYDAGWEFRPDGSYSEWIGNEDIKTLFEDVYLIKEDVKALVESRVFQRQQQLDMATLEDPNFQQMFQWAQDDLDIHSCKEL